AKAGHRQVRATRPKIFDRLAERSCHRTQHRVSDRMTERVVDPLEAVEIQIDDGDALLGFGSLAEQAFGGLQAALSIWQVRQRIVVSEAFDALGRRGPLA